MVLENSLRKAIDNEEFYILYQPKVSLQDNRVTALEALIRWQHPTLGLVPPNDFISLAEDSGLIVPLGEWVLRQACMQAKEWQDSSLPPVRVAVNLSGFQLERKDFVERVKVILEETGTDGESLEFEITETVIMQNPEFAVKILNQLRDMGIHISIDDFGTGYSSLAHLKRFSVNTLKIDKSFVSEVDLNSTDAAIATAIIAMGKSLNLSVIAEGVETKGQLDFLKKEECNEMQGYLFSEPLPADKIVELLTSNNGQAKPAQLPSHDRPVPA
jgi:EAL domain-containing protein (putative c-di-GMP-specific phosphodiesterase class I)